MIPPLINGAFHIDASTLAGRFMWCHREYEYYHYHKRESSAFKAGLRFGSFCHDELLAPHYRGTIVDIDAALPRMHPELANDYRNAGYAKVLWKLYNDTYQNEPFSVVDTPPEMGLPGNKAVELPFALPIGEVAFRSEIIPVIWTGKIDLLVHWPSEDISHIDHKTKSVGGESAWDEFVNSIQQLGYAWAISKLFGHIPSSFCINLILTRKLTATGKGIELVRQRFPLTAEAVNEVPERIMSVVAQIFDCYDRGYFPMYDTSCTRKWGKCEYIDVCKQAAAQRMQMLSTGLFKQVTWSPLTGET